MESVPQDSGVNHHDPTGTDGERMEEGGKEGKGGEEEKRKQPVEGAKKSRSSDPSSASSIPDYER